MLKCKILNKNSNAYYDVLEGAVFIENYNETLDSGTIRLAHLTNKIEIEPYDIVIVENVLGSKVQINTKTMCVDNYTCKQTSLDPAIYEYEIHLFSLTKLLEGILLPSLSITRLKTGTPRDIKTYLQWYLQLYGTKLDSNATLGKFDDLFYYSDDTLQRFENVECPEFQWNEPTLREVLTDLMMVRDSIPVCTLGEEDKIEIGFIDISSVGNEITDTQRLGINYISENQSSSDYVSELKTKLVNSVGEGEVTKICEDITFRNYGTYLLNSENVMIETSLPIWKLTKFEMRQIIKARFEYDYKYNPEPNPQYDTIETLVTKNLLPFTLEYNEWQTKDIWYEPFSDFTNLRPNANYQNMSLYFQRGTKGIHNFESKIERQKLWIKSQSSVLELILYNMEAVQYQALMEAFLQQHPIDPDDYDISYQIIDSDNNDYTKVYFRLEYEALGEHLLFASKSPFQTHQRQVVDNQSQSYVNIKNQGMLEYLKAKRLGNKVKTVNARYSTNEDTIPQLADKINGSIIFQKQIAVSNNYIKVNYQTTDNYVLRDYFTGVKSKLRSWQIVSGNEAFTRAEIIKFYVNKNISSVNSTYKIPTYNVEQYDSNQIYNPGDYCLYGGEIQLCHTTTGQGSFRPVDWTNLHTDDNMQLFLDNFNFCTIKFVTSEGDKPVPADLVYIDDNDNELYYGMTMYMLEFQKAICGNSVVFTIKMYDNAIIGKFVNSRNYLLSDGVTKSMTQKNCPYVDANGETISGTIRFYKGPMAVTSFFSTDKLPLSNLYPGIYDGEIQNLVAEIPFTVHKDNKEILQFTIQFEKNNEANDLFLGKK